MKAVPADCQMATLTLRSVHKSYIQHLNDIHLSVVLDINFSALLETLYPHYDFSILWNYVTATQQ